MFDYTLSRTKSAKSINVKALLAEGYKKCVSVTSGGKAYFYHRFDEKTGTHYWVVWNRVKRLWIWEYRENKRWQELFKT